MADRMVFSVCLGAAMFLIGLELGKASPVKSCPVVEGHRVISTSSTKDGEFCNYATSYGLGLKRKRI